MRIKITLADNLQKALKRVIIPGIITVALVAAGIYFAVKVYSFMKLEYEAGKALGGMVPPEPTPEATPESEALPSQGIRGAGLWNMPYNPGDELWVEPGVVDIPDGKGGFIPNAGDKVHFLDPNYEPPEDWPDCPYGLPHPELGWYQITEEQFITLWAPVLNSSSGKKSQIRSKEAALADIEKWEALHGEAPLIEDLPEGEIPLGIEPNE